LAEIGIDTNKFTSGANGVMGGLQKMIGGFGMTGGAIGIVTAALGVMAYQMNKAEQAAVESAKADAKLEAVLKSTGGAAGMTSKELNDYAQELSKAAGLDDELVKSAEAVLLTFTKIGQETFPETMQAAADMSAVLGTDLQGSVIQIGKAMNDFSGYTALKRAGVSFTSEQIEQIKNFKETNDQIGYQNLILRELQTEFGGAARAMNEAGDGQENMAVSLENLYEEYGTKLIPAKKAWNETIRQGADWLADEIAEQNKYDIALNALGKTTRQGLVYTKDGVVVTREMTDAYTRSAAMSDNYNDRLDKMNSFIKEVGASSEATEEELKQLSDYNEGYISNVETVTKNYESHMETQNGLAKERAKLEQERAGYIAAGYSDASEKIKGVDQSLRDNQAAIDENAAEYEKAGYRIINSMIEARLMADGKMSENDMNLLLDFQEQHGLITAEMRILTDEYLAYAAQAIDGIPKQRTVYFDMITRQYTEDYRSRGIEGGLIGRGYATGADFIVPPGFQNDSYPMRVQSGERVQVTPAGQQAPDLSELLRAIKALPRDMSKAYREAAIMGAQ
jgi:hypothetical protein